MTERDRDKVRIIDLDCGHKLALSWWDDEKQQWVADSVLLPVQLGENVHIDVKRSQYGRRKAS